MEYCSYFCETCRNNNIEEYIQSIQIETLSEMEIENIIQRNYQVQIYLCSHVGYRTQDKINKIIVRANCSYQYMENRHFNEGCIIITTDNHAYAKKFDVFNIYNLGQHCCSFRLQSCVDDNMRILIGGELTEEQFIARVKPGSILVFNKSSDKVSDDIVNHNIVEYCKKILSPNIIIKSIELFRVYGEHYICEQQTMTKCALINIS